MEATAQTPVLDAIERASGSYVQTGWMHYQVDDRGVLFAMPGPDRGIETLYMQAGEARRYFREKGGDWLRWFKMEVRPHVRRYDPRREVVVLTCPDGPSVRVVSDQSETKYPAKTRAGASG